MMKEIIKKITHNPKTPNPKTQKNNVLKKDNKINLSYEDKKKLTKESYIKIKPSMDAFDKLINDKYELDHTKFKKPNFRYYSNKNIESIERMNNAFITSIFISDDYIPAALVLAQSLKMVKTKYPIICMVQDKPYQANKNTIFKGISEKGIKDLLELFDMVIGVDLLKVQNYKKNNRLTHFTNRPTYKNILYYVTKGQILALTQFKKIFFLDASNYVGKNIDFVFDKYRHSTFQYDMEFKNTKVGYRGAYFLLNPKITYYYKLLSFVKDYNKFFNNLYFCRGIDELLIFYSIFPHWDNTKMPSNFTCAKRINRPSCDIRYFQVIKPFRRNMEERKQKIPVEIFFEWNHHAKNIINKKPHLSTYYKHIPEFRQQEIFI